jgi:hypothetical protein
MPTEYAYVSPGPVLDQFLRSDAFVVGIRGPMGSGKSTGAVAKCLDISSQQTPQKDGRRYSRGLVVRNTYPELVSTTMKTWHQWVPRDAGYFGRRDNGPPTHYIRDKEIDMEVLFVSMDNEADVKKALGMELTWAWINEAREVGKPVVDALTGRVGRFRPPKKVERPNWRVVCPQILLDTNSPELGHWWHVLAEQDTSSQANSDLVQSVKDAEKELRRLGLLGAKQPLFLFLAQPDANSPDAENRQNLPADYYQKLSAGKSEDWIKVYIRNEYGYVQDGQPVYPEFREHLHVKTFELNTRLPIDIGIDFGNTPAATIGQRGFTGIHRVRWEIVTEHCGAKQFAEVLKGFLAQHCTQFQVGSITGDPAGDADSSADIDMTCFKILRANGVDARPANTNEPRIRQEAHKNAMTKIIDGEAAYQIHQYDCPTLRQGMAGKYRMKRVATSGAGAEVYQSKPEKNMFSHVCEADQYRMIGTGEGRVVLRGTLGGKRIRPAYSIT